MKNEMTVGRNYKNIFLDHIRQLAATAQNTHSHSFMFQFVSGAGGFGAL